MWLIYIVSKITEVHLNTSASRSEANPQSCRFFGLPHLAILAVSPLFILLGFGRVPKTPTCEQGNLKPVYANTLQPT